MSPTTILISALNPDFIPTKHDVNDAGYDLRAYVETEKESEITQALSLAFAEHTKIYVNGNPVSLPVPYAKNYSAVEVADFFKSLKLTGGLGNTIVLSPYETKIISAGFKLKLPAATKGFNSVMQVYPRSGLGIKSGLILANSVGIIDQNYTAHPVMLGLHNNSSCVHLISHGTRVAQALFTTVADCTFSSVADWDSTNDRGGGLGHSGV